MSDIVRVLRILEYVGERGWVEDTLARTAVPLNGEYKVHNGGRIRSAMLGEFPEILEKADGQ